MGGHRVPLGPLDGSTGTPSNKTTSQTRVDAPSRPSQARTVYPTACRAAYGYRPTLCNRASPCYHPQARLGGDTKLPARCWRASESPLTTLKAARKPVTARVEIITVANGRGPGEDGAQFHLSVLVWLFAGQVSSPKYNRPTRAPYAKPCQSPNKSQNLEYLPVQPAMIAVHELPTASAW